MVQQAIDISRIIQRLVEMCDEARAQADVHDKAAKRSKKYKDIHTTVAVIAGIASSSVLFGLLGTIAPETTKWIGAILLFLSAYCVAINTYWKFPEREASHIGIANRLNAFADSCTYAIDEYKSGVFGSETFRVLLEHHNVD